MRRLFLAIFPHLRYTCIKICLQGDTLFAMMGKTHLTIGIAAALAATQPATVPECLAAVAAGAVGGVLCDIDTLRNDGHNDSIAVQFTALAIAACILAVDWWQNMGLCASTLTLEQNRLSIGALALFTLWVIGFFSNHRGFTHSIAAAALFSQAVWIICPALSIPFAAAYASHIFLDLLNKKGVRLLFPMKGGVHFDLFYSDRTANDLLFAFGILASAFLVLNEFALKLF